MSTHRNNPPNKWAILKPNRSRTDHHVTNKDKPKIARADFSPKGRFNTITKGIPPATPGG